MFEAFHATHNGLTDHRLNQSAKLSQFKQLMVPEGWAYDTFLKLRGILLKKYNLGLMHQFYQLKPLF